MSHNGMVSIELGILLTQCICEFVSLHRIQRLVFLLEAIYILCTFILISKGLNSLNPLYPLHVKKFSFKLEECSQNYHTRFVQWNI